MATCFVTGGTGFIGAAMVDLLLCRGHKVYALVRGGDPTRLESALHLINPYDHWKVGQGNLSIVNGDVTEPLLGLQIQDQDLLRNRIDLVFHAAGSVKFDDVQEAEQVNYKGTCNLAKTVTDLKWGRVVHFSTAYVHGQGVGCLTEKIPPLNTLMSNPYEHSKLRAEHAITRLLESQVSILRPSIVVATLDPVYRDSIPVTWSGYYGYFLGFYRLKRALEKGESLPDGITIDQNRVIDLGDTRIPGDAGAEINLIPVNHVVGMALAIATNHASGGRVFHAVNPQGPTYEPLVRQSFAVMGIRGGLIVSPDIVRDPNPIESLIWDGIKPFLPYVNRRRQFDTHCMGEFYDMGKVPRIEASEIQRLIGDALHYKFGRDLSTFPTGVTTPPVTVDVENRRSA